MNWLLKNRVGLDWVLGIHLALGGIAAAPPGKAAAPQQDMQAAYATSQPFDLEPQVERTSLELRRPNLHSLYDAIAQAYGIRLLYDRDLGEVAIASDFRLEEATLEEALEAAGSISRSFVAPLDPHTGMVAADTAEKRAEYERQVLGSFHMDAQVTPQQLTEISTALRTLVDLRRVTQDSRTNWITVRGRKRQVAVADRFVQTLQKPEGEVLLEVEVWEVNRRRARELGILPPQPFQLRFEGETAGSGTATLDELGKIATFYGAQLAGLTALLETSTSLVRSHQVVRLRASDGQPANLLVGERVPVIRSFLGSSLELGGGAAASTGFIPAIEYHDVGVVVKATPYLHANREVTLNLDLALRNLGPRDKNGLPTFGNRQITGQVRLKDGESFVMAGMLTGSDQEQVTGYPWLARLPLIGWLFSSRGRQRFENELILLIRPYVLRFAPAEEIASRAIFFGRELTGLPAVVAPTPAPAPGQPVPGVPPGVPPVPGVAPPPGVPTPPGLQPQPGIPQQPGAQPQPGVFPGIGFPPGVVPQPIPPLIEEPLPPETTPQDVP